MINKTKIIIVDDHSITLAGIKSIIDNINSVEVAGIATSGKEALVLLCNTIPDILITDIEMADVNGIELSKIVKKKFPLIKIIALTQHRERWIISKLVNMGVDAVVLKSKVDHDELQLALKSIDAGKKYYSSELAELFMQKEKIENGVPFLTMREKEILTLICQENKTKEISATLAITDSTVETHRKNLFVKLKVKSQSGLVREAIKYGYYEFE